MAIRQKDEALLEKLLIDLSRLLKSGTPAERRIAKYLMEHLAELPFETAATLAEKLGLSPMTVGRFLRSLGYRQLSDIRDDLRERGTASAADEEQQKADRTPQPPPLSALMMQQIKAVQAAYDLSNQPVWQSALAQITDSRNVFIASSGESFGISRYFYTKLLECRGRVHYLQKDEAAFIELMDEAPEDTLLILVDCGSNLSSLRRIGDVARLNGYRTLLITGRFYEWGPDSADICLTPPLRDIENETVLHLFALLEFLVASLSRMNTTVSQQRSKRIGDLQRALKA